MKELFFPSISFVDYDSITTELLIQARGRGFNFLLIPFTFLENSLLFPSVSFAAVAAAAIVTRANLLCGGIYTGLSKIQPVGMGGTELGSIVYIFMTVSFLTHHIN